MMSLFEKILKSRGLTGDLRTSFLLPDYSLGYDPFYLTDMDKAIKRLVLAHKKQDTIIIYGDYDIDGLTASTLLFDAFGSFGFKNLDIFIPNRFIEGYGMTVDAVEKIAQQGAKLIVTVDCGGSSEKEITRANELGVDVIVTDHHNIISKIRPSAVAVINPKNMDDKYPFKDLAGVGVAFKLIQALQSKLDGLSDGQEKWLLDLVALGTVCDTVPLIDENRTYVFWGLKVLSKTKRPGLKALMAIAGIDPKTVNARSLGFGLGPRMNAAGRLETAKFALDMLRSCNPLEALEKAEYLDALNKARRADQDKIFKQAARQAESYTDDSVLVVSDPDWNHGIVGIVASKLLEKYKKPTFVLQEISGESKGSARSFGDFSIIDAIVDSKDIITHGGGHHFAAGVTMPTKNIDKFRKQVNKFYKNMKLVNQAGLLLPVADAVAELNEVTEDLIDQIKQLEPFGEGNPQPILRTNGLIVKSIRKMGADNQHLKLGLRDSKGQLMEFISFGAPDYFFVQPGMMVDVWYQPDVNEWRGNRTVEGRLLHIETKE